MKLKIQYKPIQDLIPYARNSRTHNDAQVAQIAASIKEFGWTNPVLLDGENGIIAGHGRVLAAQKLGETEVPTIELSHMDENQKRAYIIADNKLALNAGWDNEMLALEVADLKDAGYDLGLTGFSLDEIAALNGEADIDEDFKEPIDESRNLLMIECQGERELETLYEEMQQRGFECKILS
jgi:ParB-like chromosome segregation protein Spo0J